MVHNVSKVSEDFVSLPPEKKRRVWEVLRISDIKDIKYIKISKTFRFRADRPGVGFRVLFEIKFRRPTL